MQGNDLPQPLPPVPTTPEIVLVSQTQASGTMVPRSPVNAAMAPRHLLASLQQAAADSLNFRIQQAAAEGPLNITVSSTMNVSVERMNDVINSVGPQQDVSIVDLMSEEGDQSLHQLTAMMEELPDDVLNRTLTPDLNITGHIIEEVTEPIQHGP